MGLNGLIAQRRGIQTMGFIGKEGLGKVGVRDHLVLWGEMNSHRQVLVGCTGDALVCAGGKKGTEEECLTALVNGSAVLLLALRDDYPEDSLPNNYHESEGMSVSVASGQMVVCQSIDDIPASVDRILDVNTGRTRTMRRDIVTQVPSTA